MILGRSPDSERPVPGAKRTACSSLISISTQGLYVLRDGVDGPAGFPTIGTISYKLETSGEDCKLTVRVKASSPRGVAGVFVNAYVEPSNFARAVSVVVVGFQLFVLSYPFLGGKC